MSWCGVWFRFGFRLFLPSKLTQFWRRQGLSTPHCCRARDMARREGGRRGAKSTEGGCRENGRCADWIGIGRGAHVIGRHPRICVFFLRERSECEGARAGGGVGWRGSTTPTPKAAGPIGPTAYSLQPWNTLVAFIRGDLCRLELPALHARVRRVRFKIEAGPNKKRRRDLPQRGVPALQLRCTTLLSATCRPHGQQAGCR
jgi:hypothetical protein